MGCLGDRWHEISEGVELVDRTRQGYQNRRACSWPVMRGKQSNMGDGAGYIQSDELAVFWTRGAELTARMYGSSDAPTPARAWVDDAACC